MEVKEYLVNGKKYRVSSDREKDFLAKFPNAQLLGKTNGSAESATEESKPAQQPPKTKTEAEKIEQDTALSLEDGSLDYVTAALEKHRQYNATEEQKAEAKARAEERVGYLNSPNAKSEQALRKEIRGEDEEEGFFDSMWETLGRSFSLTPENVALNKEAKDRLNANIKEDSQLTNEALASMLAIHNEGLPSDQRVRKFDDDGRVTDEYYNWVSSISDEKINQFKVDELSGKYEDEFFDKNVEEEMEDRASWHGATRSESQTQEEELAMNAISQLDEEKAKLIKRQNALTNGMKGLKLKYDAFGLLNDKLADLNARMEKIVSVQYKDQESYDAANKELDALKSQFTKLTDDYFAGGGLPIDQLNRERDSYLRAFGRVEDAMEGFNAKEQDLNTYLDAMGRNYGWSANLAMGLASGGLKLGAGLVQACLLYTSPSPRD